MKIILNENQNQLRRRISKIDEMVSGWFTFKYIKTFNAIFDGFYDMVIEDVVERMYYHYFQDLDDESKEWEEIYKMMLQYIDLRWKDELKEYFNMRQKEYENRVKLKLGK
jgi:DNA-binding protein Fis